MKKTLALFLALVMLMASLVTTAGAEAAQLEVLKIGVAKLPTTMDPSINDTNQGTRIYYNAFETLLKTDQKNDFSLQGMLATEWKRIDDYTLELKLREGVKFHNGAEMTAEDVKYTFERVLFSDDLAGNIVPIRNLISTITEINAIDTYTVQIKTEKVDPILEYRIASTFGCWILPKGYLEEVGNEAFQTAPIGTGPYKVVSYSPEKVVLERFDEYWGELPAVKTIEWILYPEATSRITALMNGEIDLVVQVPPDQIDLLNNTPGTNVLSLTLANYHMLTFNTQAGPDYKGSVLADKKVRQALSLGIDRQLLCDTLWGGLAVVPRGPQYKQFGDLYLEDYPLPEYNVEKAKALLAESSYNGEVIEYELTPGYYTFDLEAATAIVDMWKEIGVNAELVYRDAKQFNQVCTYSNTMRFPDPCGGLWMMWGTGSQAHGNWWADMPQEYIDIGNTLATELGTTESRRELFRQLMDIWNEEVPGIVMYYPTESWAIRDGLEWTPYASQVMDFRADNFKVIK